MARAFSRASSQSITAASSTALELGTGPFSVAATIYPYTVDYTATSSGVVFSKGIDPSNYFDLEVYQSKVRAGVGTALMDSPVIPVNAVYRVMVTRSGTALSLYVNGALVASSTSSASVSNPTKNVTIGVRPGTSYFFNGEISEVAMWSAALGGDEMIAYMKTYSAAVLRPQALVFYAPLVRDVVELKRGLALTNNGTTVVPHQRIRF
ncbi:LamG domain-containing protein [Roseimicrobium sp. ORNL1]|uniref:LamG domain-containing protein n=1 Tax=Roseimicrobium sp. ORNL1 TaxID=2711231 RepID=UPI0013E0F572|nr:LamG domain-containing protein [Roseimicrobium sp. ORNL1]QIF01904.1 LamG domain-containing protein [Roseimicrobium sp. ORNL1]